MKTQHLDHRIALTEFAEEVARCIKYLSEHGSGVNVQGLYQAKTELIECLQPDNPKSPTLLAPFVSQGVFAKDCEETMDGKFCIKRNGEVVAVTWDAETRNEIVRLLNTAQQHHL